jgi:two-component system response regulator AtoC
MRVLLVDDERRLAESLAEYLRAEGIEAIPAFDGMEGRRLLEESPYDALVTDLRMPGLDGLALLRWVREEGPSLPVVVISAHGEVRDAVAAMKAGAYDYLVKPFDPDELSLKLRKAVEERRSSDRLTVGASRFGEGQILVGESPAIKAVLRLIEKAAPAHSTVLVTGESGTGKEIAARLIHDRSEREGAFVPVNVGALPDQLVESELFGYEKGAFTGADSRKAGLFEAANGGTLFLDEIGELPLHLQVKLLRVIQDRKVLRVGAVKGIPIDVRLVAATNRDLEAEVRAGRFREDLYYRVNVIRLEMPPLRDREGDVALLAGYFLRKLSGELARKVDGISPEAHAVLESYPFPGNVRELENAVERALILSEGARLESRDFRFFGQAEGGMRGFAARTAREAARKTEADSGETPRSLAELERIAIESALKRNAYRRERSAVELGITRRTLLNKIKEYGIEVPGGST